MSSSAFTPRSLRLIHRLCVHLILALLCVLAHASGPVLAKVVDISDTGYILQIGKETVPVCDSAKTKFWAKKKIAQRGDFTKDMSVWVRIKGDTTPGFLREIVDEESQKWLDSIRKTVVVGEFRKLDDKYATFAFSDGTEFSYRCTEKSKLTILGKDGSFAEVKEGTKLFLKGRTLPTLDTWLVSASDAAPTPKTKLTKRTQPKGTSGSGEASAPLPATGTIEGVIEVHLPQWRMFDVPYQGVRLHITYTNATVFMVDKKKAGPQQLARGIPVRVRYRRDEYGRILATKVEMSG